MTVHPIGPVFDARSKILILGSFPSVKSREERFYYSHPQNRFWRVLSAVCGKPLPQTAGEKRNFLLDARIALWDVIASCEIEGSSDSSIRGVTANDIGIILDAAPVTRIFVNGKTAEKYYVKYLEKTVKKKAEYLPSTSPANASCTLEKLTEKWSVIGKALAGSAQPCSGGFIYGTPDGIQNLLIRYRGGRLCGITFTDETPREKEPPVPEETAQWLDRYFSGQDPGKAPGYEITGVSEFCERVLSLVAEIPYGETVSYGELAERYCRKYACGAMSARAVGQALGKNPVAVVVPCHRVIGSNGSMTGYSGGCGIKNKEYLLGNEKRHVKKDS